MSAYVNAATPDGVGPSVQVSGTTGGSSLTCPSQSFTANGNSGAPTKVFFGGSGACTADTLSITAPYTDGSTVGNFISLDDFVVCSANALSGLLPKTLTKKLLLINDWRRCRPELHLEEYCKAHCHSLSLALFRHRA